MISFQAQSAVSRAPAPAPGFSVAPSRPVFQPGQGPNTIGEAYQPVGRQDGPQQTYKDIIAEQQRVEEVQILIFHLFFVISNDFVNQKLIF